VRKDITFAVAAVVVIGLVCFALNAARPALPLVPSHPFEAAKATPARGALPNEKVVMHVNGEPVTEREFMMWVMSAPEEMRSFYAGAQGRELLAQEIVKIKALSQEAERLGLTTEAETATRLNVDRSNILAGMALRKIVPRPSEQRLQAEYAKDKKNFETVEISHILVAYAGGQIPPRTGRPQPAAQAMGRAREIATRLRAGADFAKVAQTESDDLQSGRAGGVLGPIPPGAMPPVLDAVVQKLKPGEISDPVQSQFGIHIFKAGERKAQPLGDQVREALTTRIQRADAEVAVQRLQKQAKVELDPKFFGKATLSPMPMGASPR
jgi:parvulin-like peptidyl-prolyl isomerase